MIQKIQRDILLPWEELPEFMRTEAVKPYWEVLWKLRSQLAIKRIFDVIGSIVMIIVLLIPMLIIAIVVKTDSPGPVFYRQVRITQYGRKFRIFKFRTMYDEASRTVNGVQVGNSITIANDSRVTRVGKVLRKYRLDEFPQLFNVLVGDMSFVGTRPEVPKYVEKYKDEWNATLLLPAGITSECSIRFKDEDMLFTRANEVDKSYIEDVLPEKMRWNMKSMKMFSLFYEIRMMVSTVFEVLGKEYC